MSGYERGIAAERARLMKEFEQRHQTTPLDVSKEHLEPEEVENNEMSDGEEYDESNAEDDVQGPVHYATEDTLVSQTQG